MHISYILVVALIVGVERHLLEIGDRRRAAVATASRKLRRRLGCEQSRQVIRMRRRCVSNRRRGRVLG